MQIFSVYKIKERTKNSMQKRIRSRIFIFYAVFVGTWMIK